VLCNLGRPRHFGAGRYGSSSLHSSSDRSVGYLLFSMPCSLPSSRHLFQTVSTASLTQNDLPTTVRPARIGGRKGYKEAQNTPKGSQKWAKIDVPERDNAK
jgi:hypothetical protein